ncbi:MAG: hypothetical protein HOP02_05720 [Methylococcaceae bacterium]|nr:hypothetical protein [Methylococcaceae bacterium]
MLAALRKLFTSSLFLLYPYLVYRGLQAGFVWLAPAIVSAILLQQALGATDVGVRNKKALLALSLMGGMVFFPDFTAKLIPSLIQLALMHFFGKTLIKGPPLIERFVRLEFSDIPEELLTYVRHLTIVWTAFFGFNVLMCSGLALWGQPAWWALYSGVIMFALTGLLMVGEYIFRHYRFPTLEIPDVKASMRTMILNSRQIWLDVQAS